MERIQSIANFCKRHVGVENVRQCCKKAKIFGIFVSQLRRIFVQLTC